MMRGVLAAAMVSLAAGAADAERVEYERDIKPLLAHKCGACHGVLKQEAGLRLDAGVLIHQGSESGSVLVAGDSAASVLLERVSASDPADRMPPEGEGESMTSEQLALLRSWIDQGAKFPAEESIPVGPREHWAYQTPARPDVPAVDDPQWSHPVDAFIHREHRRLRLQPVARADSFTLYRRLSFDLVGLPPAPSDLLSFVDQDSPAAWREAVDALLENPHYGERWGRHWMDVWRYSDWNGYKEQLRGSQRHIWHWRDWIIESLNEDKGYDQMVLEMLAGDEIAPDDPTVLAATGFLARNYHNSNRNIWLDATVEHTAKAFLGLTLNCARCHDHKYDPIPQREYYQFRAIFEPHQVRTDQVPGQLDTMQDGIPRVFDDDAAAPTYVFVQGNEKLPDKQHPVTPQVPEVLGRLAGVEAVDLPAEASHPALRRFVQQDRVDQARSTLAAAEKAISGAAGDREAELLEQQRAVAQLSLYAIERRFEADEAKLRQHDDAEHLATIAALVERQFRFAEAQLAVFEAQRALAAAEEKAAEKDADKKRAAIEAAETKLAAAEKKFAAARDQLSEEPAAEYSPLGKHYPATSSGRRAALAHWITSPENPLAARVAVNHIWLRHFGQPLVENVFDFGLRSPRPPHADLLDWLAVELIENGWSMKHLHRLILTSQTWQLASTAGNAANPSRRLDQDNRYLWRMDPRRLDAEIVRDNVLAVSGGLDRTFGGPDIDFQDGESTGRRSIYIRHAYEKQMTMLVLFDAASPNECYRRSESIVPQQALAMTNSSLALGRSRQLAGRIWQQVAAEADTDADHESLAADFIERAYLLILSRFPLAPEQQASLEFLASQAALFTDTKSLTRFVGGEDPVVAPAGDPAQRARENLVQVLMNHNDFFTVR